MNSKFFFKGMTSSFELFPSDNKIDFFQSFQSDDMEALKHDWISIGQDISNSMVKSQDEANKT